MPPIIVDIEQHSPEWFAACCGNVGASTIDKIITADGKRSKQRDDFLRQLAGERVCGKREETYQSQAMLNGIEREASARALFEMLKDVEVRQVGLIYKDDKKLCHCSPDGLIGNDAGIEIKAPMLKTHVKYLLDGRLPVEYFSQVQMSLYVSERDKWWFMSYYEELPPLMLEIGRDTSFIAKLDAELRAFNAELLEIVGKLERLAA